MSLKALVVGAGLAGLAAAIRLAKRGAGVTLVERRAFAGGRAYSFKTPEGLEIDNGQHVIIGCCTDYLGFLDEIGARDLLALQPRCEVPFVDTRSGRVAWMREGWLPAPCHFATSLLAYHPLSWKERRAAVGAAQAMRQAAGPALETQSYGDWLREHGQSTPAIELFWNVSSVAILNEHVDRVSAAVGIFVMKTAFFGDKPAARVGIAKVPLGAIAAKAVERARALGVDVQFNRKIERLPDPAFDATISAVPAKALLDLVEPHPFFEPARAIETSPIVNLHVTFDRPVADYPMACYLASPVQWVFDHGDRVVLSQSAARGIIDVPNPELEKRFVDELRRILPKARDAKLVRCTIVREREATFVAAPGKRSSRLPCVTPVKGLYLAGEWTESDWPSTMEGALRSGNRAADLVLGR